MTQINRNDFEINVWEDFIQDYYDVERSYTQLKFIFELNEEWNSDFPELWGFWETKWFDRDELISEDYPPHEYVHELFRTELKSETVIRTRWFKITEE